MLSAALLAGQQPVSNAAPYGQPRFLPKPLSAKEEQLSGAKPGRRSEARNI